MDGLLIADKPAGMTSADVVRIVKQRLRCKTGHLGTLDPFASGVLPLCIGEGTKIAQFLNEADKEYTGLIRLGTKTDTGDPTGAVTATAAVPPVDVAVLAAAAQRFHGEIVQIPPMYSAIKHQGTPLYKLARKGIEIERQPRSVRIDALTLTRPSAETIELTVACSKGTYIRVLAEEISYALGSVGHLQTLRRTRFGPFGVADAVSIAAIEAGAASVIGLREALRHLREIAIDRETARRAKQGYEPLLASITLGARSEAAKLVGPDGELAAVIVMDPRHGWRFARVFGDGTRTRS